MIIPCSDIGPRPAQEFRWGGVVAASDADGAQEWRHALWGSTVEGISREWWFHLPTDQWYISERDISGEEILTARPAQSVLSSETAP